MQPSDVDDFLRAVDRRAARRFLPEPLPPTGWGVPLDFATEPGRAALIQVHDFEETK
jgi:hypothetical protein